MGCSLRRSIATTTVLSILLLTTRPSSRRRLLGIVVSLALLPFDLTFAQQGQNTRDVALGVAQGIRVFQLPKAFLETQVEQRLFLVFELIVERRVVHVAQFSNSAHSTPPTS